MGIDARHAYRFGYLKSEHWQNLRLEKMASVDAKCARCGVRDLSNDVHHLRYKKLYDVVISDLLVLCRTCHGEVHLMLDRVRDFPAAETWKAFLSLWGGQPHKIRELWELMAEMRRANKMPKLKERQAINAK